MVYRHLIIGVLLVSLGACASMERTVWSARKSAREPGERVLTLPDEVWQEYNCGSHRLPFLKIETNEIVPPRLNAGEEFNHRLVYTLCTSERREEILGQLYTRIYYRGRVYAQELTENYAMKPGRWQVDTFIGLPQDLEHGVYALELDFRSASLNFQGQQSFVVE